MFTWLGIEPEEGPDIGGPNGPYRQSERLDIYRQHVQQLLDEGKAYRAFETAEELEAMRVEQKRLNRPLGYDGRGRSLSKEEQERRAAAGEPHVVRLITPDEGSVTFLDRLRVRAIPASGARPGAVQGDGYPTYHLANVVDDHLMGVTHVIAKSGYRAPPHQLLYQAFGWDRPSSSTCRSCVTPTAAR